MPSQVASIQSAVEGQIYSVNVYFVDGSRLLVDIQGDFDSSRKLAVNLTRAQEELKAARRRPPETADKVIN